MPSEKRRRQRAHVRPPETPFGPQNRGCARCGACCAPVTLAFPLWVITRWSTRVLQGSPDPRTDEGWAAWVGIGWPPWKRDEAIRSMDPKSDRRLNADFAEQHWTQEWLDAGSNAVVTCDQYDPEARLCKAGDKRPPICSGFPWYGETDKDAEERRNPTKLTLETGEVTPDGRPLHCSYLGEVASELREDRHPLIPIFPV